jgi:quinol monooxygenase YgiN
MSKVAVIATIEVEPGTRIEVAEIMRRHRERCLRDEPGTLIFELMVPRDDENKLMVYEAYESQAAFDAHWTGASLAICRQEAGSRMKIVGGTWGVPVL